MGFDLDMTLVDSRAGIVATLEELSRELDVFIDAPVVVGRLGPTLEDELAEWLPAERVLPAADRFRDLYVGLGVPGTELLPGAADAVAAVHELGGRTVVVTAKYEPNAHLCLAHVGLDVGRVFGWRHGPGKGETLADEGAAVYVGDTPADMIGARVAEAFAIGVTSGPHPADELTAAGADLVIASLVEFRPWLRGWASSR